MADGYARSIRGKPGVAVVVPGVGLYNAASGPGHRACPLLARALRGRTPFRAHQMASRISAPFMRSQTNWTSYGTRNQVATAGAQTSDVPGAVAEAFRQMRTSRSRPVVIEIPPDASVEREEVELREPFRVPRIVPSPEHLREAARVIAQSRLPLIYAGGGVARSDAEAAIVKLAEATNIPVMTSTGG